MQMHFTINPDPPAPISKRAETARINGAKSRGPATPEGLARSSRNSLRHGLTARAVVLETESKQEFQRLLDSFLDRFRPSDPVEAEVVEAMAAARWRLRRLYAIESSILDNELLRRADSIDEEFTNNDDNDRLAHAFQHLADHGRSLALLVRYEAALNRTFDRALKQLILLQSAAQPAATPHTPGSLGSFRNPRKPPAGSAIEPCPSVSIREPILPSSASPRPLRTQNRANHPLETPSPETASPSDPPRNPPPARPKRVE